MVTLCLNFGIAHCTEIETADGTNLVDYNDIAEFRFEGMQALDNAKLATWVHEKLSFEFHGDLDDLAPSLK